jgi:serine/threonine protein kinase
MAELSLAFVGGPGGFRKFVALKRILPALRADEDFVTMFLDEARISASLSHANIAQVFELGEDRQEYFIALEFIEGQDLGRIGRAALSEGQPVPTWFAASVGRDMCAALGYAHEFVTPSGRTQPIIHRDIKPGNVMVTYSGVTKLIDFGIAKAKGAVSITRSGVVRGSLGYMSPEQVEGLELDARSDVFCAGVVLYELLTAIRPFQGDSESAVVKNISTLIPDAPSELVASVPQALSEVVLKAMAKEPGRRFANGNEMAAAIEAAGPISSERERRVWMQQRFASHMGQLRKLFATAEQPDDRRVQEAARHLKLAESSESEVPTSELEPADTPSSGAREARAGTAPMQPTILVVDDSKLGRHVVTSVLTTNGFTVLEAESGEQALEMLAQISPDLIVLDVVMTGIDGFETCAQLRAMPTPRRCPVIFLSAACSMEERSRCLDVGGDDFMRKPFNAVDLLTRVRTHLERAR